MSQCPPDRALAAHPPPLPQLWFPLEEKPVWHKPMVFPRKISFTSDGNKQEPKGEDCLLPLLPLLCSLRTWNTAQHMLIPGNIWVVLGIPSLAPPVEMQWTHWVFPHRHIIPPLDMVANRITSYPGCFMYETCDWELQVDSASLWPKESLVLKAQVHQLPSSLPRLGKSFSFQHLLGSFYSLALHKECSKLKAFSSHIRDTFAELRYF